jgi:hypothetical protein
MKQISGDISAIKPYQNGTFSALLTPKKKV